MKKVFAQNHEGKAEGLWLHFQINTGILDRQGDEVVTSVSSADFTKKELKIVLAFPGITRQIKREIEKDRRKVFADLKRGYKIRCCGLGYEIQEPK